GNVNFGQAVYNGWASTVIQTCNGTATVSQPLDVTICNGQLHEASNDNPTLQFDAGGVTVLAMYPKQPFGLAGRTGTVSCEVSNDSHGPHSAWPEFWMSNLPVPAPFSQWPALPEHGFGINMSAAAGAGNPGSCPNPTNLDKRRWTVNSVIV